MSKPREFWIKIGSDREPNTIMENPHSEDKKVTIHVREVIPDDEKGDKYLAMCKYVDLKNEELGRVTRALEKAKNTLREAGCLMTVFEIEAIERGEK